MMKSTLLATIVLLLSGGIALADHHTAPDAVCIVFDYPTPYIARCATVSGPIPVYIVLMNATGTGGIVGYEFCICNADGMPFLPPPDCFVIDYIYPPGAINISLAPCFTVGIFPPVPWEPVVLLLTIDLFISGSVPWCFGLTPPYPASLPTEMSYADGDDPGILIPMVPCGISDPDDACTMACINSPDCVVGIEQVTWGSIKSVYR